MRLGRLKRTEALREDDSKLAIHSCLDTCKLHPNLLPWPEQEHELGNQVVTDKLSRFLFVTDRDFHETAETKGCDLVTDIHPLTEEHAPVNDEEVIRDLARLSLIEYDRVRVDKAGLLGVRVTLLDKLVKIERESPGIGEDLPFREVVTWEKQIDPAELLTQISITVRRFIICSQEVADAVALWAAMTWFMDVVQVAPLAVITAPEKRCGKTMLLTILGKLSARPITASNISPAALFRAIDAWKPTLLIDETDACLRDNEELRGIINSGHTRDSAYVIRTVGETFTPTKFSTWGAKALSGIGHLSATLMDRAVVLELPRKLATESVERIRHAEPDLFPTLAAKLARFANDCAEAVRQARPSLPQSLNDRAQDNWEPLLAIAMVAGQGWFETATKAALKLSGSESSSLSQGTELLGDIKEMFELNKIDRMATTDLLRGLCEDEEKPWATYDRGFPIKPRQLAAKLKDYGIYSKTIRLDFASTAKGYELDQFSEAFARYLGPPLYP